MKVKVVQATMKKLPSGKMEFKSENQTYVTVTEGTANLDYVSQAVQRKWGSHYVLVTSDGLKLDDSAQGIYICSWNIMQNTLYIPNTEIQFWKVGSRKIYAVRELDLRLGRVNKATISDTESSDEEFMPLPKRSKRIALCKGQQLADIDQLLTEVWGLRSDIGHLFEVNQQLPVPIGLQKALIDTFRCCICQSTMLPPVIFGRCCKSLIGCQS